MYKLLKVLQDGNLIQQLKLKIKKGTNNLTYDIGYLNFPVTLKTANPPQCYKLKIHLLSKKVFNKPTEYNFVLKEKFNKIC